MHPQSLPAPWYYDVVSPWAYLYWKRRGELAAAIQLQPVLVLFAGLLKHFGHKGPAEIPGKREQTYLMCAYLAERHGVAFRMPSRHPFNPLHALRLLIGVNAGEAAIDASFDFIFGQGRDPETDLPGFAAALGVSDPEAILADPVVKERLKENTRAAAAANVFGVPTLVVRGRPFWGFDTIEWVNDYVADPDLFERPCMRRAASVEPGTRRPQS